MFRLVSAVVVLVVLQQCAAQGPCADALAKVEAILSESPRPGLERPRCAADGTYLGMQYGGSQAFCVTSTGVNIEGYSVNRWETGTDMNCNCARDQHEYQQTGMLGKMFSCEPNGNYSPSGCTGSVCYCQDSNGQQIGEGVHIAQSGSLNC
ncbi:hypothetical protein ACF0H5_012499 [Mactra antiquata]